MRYTRHLLAAALAAGTFAGAAAPADAQIVIRESAPRGWLGISYVTDRPETAGDRAVVRITDVIAGSPAERAGLRAEDIVLSVNGLSASDQLIGSLAYSLAPGESVNLRIRRANAEHDVTVVTAERPANVAMRRGESITINTDSILGLARGWLDSARIHLDGVRLPDVILDMSRARGDSIYVRSGEMPFFRVDTVGPGRIRVIMRGDTLLRAEMDSVARRLGAVRWMEADSAVRFMRPLPGMEGRAGFEGVSFYSMRSIAGAELVRLEPGMDSYFGTADGALVVRVGEDTPAARAGLRAGDVVIGVNAERVASVEDVRRLVAAAPRDRPVRLEVFRERRSIMVELPRQ